LVRAEHIAVKVNLDYGLIQEMVEKTSAFQKEEVHNNVFLNSMGKAGTHLVKNILMAFLPEHQLKNFYKIDSGNYAIAYDPNKGPMEPFFSKNEHAVFWGHLPCFFETEDCVRDCRHIILVRDPYTYVLAKERFLLSKQTQNDVVKKAAEKSKNILKEIILGGLGPVPPLRQVYDQYVMWLGSGAKFVRYEDVVSSINNIDSPEAEVFFSDFFDFIGMESLPKDWKDRIKIGSDAAFSPTHRQNLTYKNFSGFPYKKELDQEYKDLIDYTCPNLRAILGYK
jgi:hypothetical protein